VTHDVDATSPPSDRQLEAQLEAARRADRAKSRFLADISHEIRTQLAGIIGMTQLTLETKLTPDQREYLELASTSADALLTLVNDLLDMSKIESGKLEIAAESFSLRDLLADISALSRAQAAEKGIDYGIQIAADVPFNVTGDPGRVRQILLNLISNAMKHTDAGGVTVSVSVSERVGNDVVVEMDVVDTGEGIPQEELGSIFDAYEQAGGGAVRRKGTGLGLSICRQLVGLMGGRIWAESELGHGSAFHVTIPLGIHLGNVQLIQPVRSELDDLPVLVVASSRFIKERYVMAAEQIGLSVVSVESRQEAIAALGMASAADHPFALAIVTLDGDGLDFAAELRRRPDLEQMHMLVVTSVGQRGDAKRCHESNIAGYLTMPIGEDELERAIRAVLTGPSPVDLSTLVTKHWLRERRNHLSLLVVDDSPTNRMVARRLLERRGHRVDIAESGYDAIKAVEEHRFDVILLDVQLPDIDAREVASTIRRYGPDTPIIGMAPKKTDGLVNVMTRTGIDEIISKPLQVAELLRTIESRVEDSSAAGM
jgi:two-component system, sensor histidine kinase and response regulator